MRINASKHEARLHLPDLNPSPPIQDRPIEEVDAINVA